MLARWGKSPTTTIAISGRPTAKRSWSEEDSSSTWGSSETGTRTWPTTNRGKRGGEYRVPESLVRWPLIWKQFISTIGASRESPGCWPS